MSTSPFIDAGELAERLGGENAPAVLDASYRLLKPAVDGDYRSESARDDWLAGHIPGSIHVEITEDFSVPDAATHYAHPEPQAIADALAARGIGPDTEVVVYDSTGGLFAARLWWLLHWIGVPVRVLDGGLAAWRAAELPLEAGETTVAARESWPASAARESWIELDELLARDDDDTRPLVCGLPAGSFLGTEPSRYARRGHIPGSVNVSSRELFGPDGRVLSDEALRAAYAAQGVIGAEPEPEEVLLYCGGGISASANALTLAQLGITTVRIYDASLEEWAARPELPLVVAAA